jgi:AmmeMemoRadiSam system protein B
MRMIPRLDTADAPARRPAVAGSFYPADRDELAQLVDRLLAAARPPNDALAAVEAGLAGILVPHAGLSYSGHVAATAWRLAAGVPVRGERSSAASGATPFGDSTVVLLGTNHSAGWLDGVGVWDAGAWLTPLGEVGLDEGLAAEIVALGPPFAVDRDAHRSEHSLEVQLPFVCRALPGARIVPLAIGTGRGDLAVRAGDLLGTLIAQRRATGADVRLAISTDMAHYPPAAIGAQVTDDLAPIILALDPTRLARREADIARSGLQGVVCGMCGIEPTVVGLAALRAMGVRRGVRLAAATSADAGGAPEQTVGYLAAAFPG